MARFKPYLPEQGRLLPVVFDQQIQPGTFEFAVHHLGQGKGTWSI